MAEIINFPGGENDAAPTKSGDVVPAPPTDAGADESAPESFEDTAHLPAAFDGDDSITMYPNLTIPVEMPLGFRLTDTGMEKLIFTKEGEYWDPVCSPIAVLGMARTEESEDWALLARTFDPDGVGHDVMIPFTDFSGDGSPVMTALRKVGLRLQPGFRAKARLIEYLTQSQPKQRFLLVDQCGWAGNDYVLPHKTFGGSKRNVLLRHSVRREHRFGVKGTLAEWQELAKLAIGNSRLIMGVCAGFMGPLLRLAGREGGGFHLRGGSSIGKTTALYLAGSIWGGGGQHGMVNSWRLTDNAAEGMAKQRNDGMLALDEMGLCEAAHLAAIAYMLANGEAKGRATIRGELRSPSRWVLVFLSTGEIGLADKLAEEGRGRKVRAGQEVRVVDIPADAGKGMGIIEELHGFPDSRALVQHITKTAKAVYGGGADAFLTELVECRDDVAEWIAEYTAWFVAERCPAEADPQVSRVADRFALAGAAGELAAKFDILPWDEGEATLGVARCFEDWVKARGGLNSREEQQVLQQVLDILAKDGASRFDDFHSESIVSESARNRLGWRFKNRDNVWEYYVTAAGFAEMHAGFDRTLAIEVLVKKGILRSGKDDPSITPRIPGHKRPRVYHLCPHDLEEEVQN